MLCHLFLRIFSDSGFVKLLDSLPSSAFDKFSTSFRSNEKGPLLQQFWLNGTQNWDAYDADQNLGDDLISKYANNVDFDNGIGDDFLDTLTDSKRSILANNFLKNLMYLKFRRPLHKPYKVAMFGRVPYVNRRPVILRRPNSQKLSYISTPYDTPITNTGDSLFSSEYFDSPKMYGDGSDIVSNVKEKNKNFTENTDYPMTRNSKLNDPEEEPLWNADEDRRNGNFVPDSYSVKNSQLTNSKELSGNFEGVSFDDGVSYAFTPRVGRGHRIDLDHIKRSNLGFTPRVGKRDQSEQARLVDKKSSSFIPRVGKRPSAAIASLDKRELSFTPRMGKRRMLNRLQALRGKKDFAFNPRIGKKDTVSSLLPSKRYNSFTPRVG